MNETSIKMIPYGISDYTLIRQDNYYYVDKTAYIPIIERSGRYLFFIRPRRFGKSLLLNVLDAYYSIAMKDKFDFFFKGTEIYHHPTTERNAYMILKLNFSATDPESPHIENSLYTYMLEVGELFISTYHPWLGVDETKSIAELKTRETVIDALRYLISLGRKSGHKLYVIIDEYDNFANTILTTSGKDAYQRLTHGEGFFKAIFSVLKEGTTSNDAPITRLFITGVSPVTLDDVTSGFNIGKNISLEPSLGRMLGFTQKDVAEMIDYYRQNGWIDHSTEYLMSIMEEFYGNYRFTPMDDVKLFNPDMVLYFMDNYLEPKKIPEDLIDRNVRIDYGKLRHLIILDQGKTKITNGNFSKLKEIIEEGETTSLISKGFPLDEMMNSDNFKSLLFYFGLLTIKGTEKDRLRLEIPNETIRRLYYDYIKAAYRETGVFSIDLSHYSSLMTNMAYDGEWQPLFDYLSGCIRESMSLRDLMTGEKSIQAFLNIYLGLSNLFIIHTEKELNKGYADIVMEPFTAGYEGIKYSYVLEIKYIKKSGEKRKTKPSKAVIEKLKIDAGEQLQRYSIDEKFRKSMESTHVIKLVLIFHGSDLIFIGPQ
ncbi:MAG: AAA family ATPase [Candidatus Omnitrophota bacterium]